MAKWAWLAWRVIRLVDLTLGLNGNAGCPDLDLPSQFAMCNFICKLLPILSLATTLRFGFSRDYPVGIKNALPMET